MIDVYRSWVRKYKGVLCGMKVISQKLLSLVLGASSELTGVYLRGIYGSK